MNRSPRPIHEIRLGSIKAAVWKNENNGIVHYSTTFSRLYKDGEHWASSESIGSDDLLTLAKLADQTHSRICAQARPDEA